MPHPHEVFPFCVQEAAIQRKRDAANRIQSRMQRGCLVPTLLGLVLAVMPCWRRAVSAAG